MFDRGPAGRQHGRRVEGNAPTNLDPQCVEGFVCACAYTQVHTKVDFTILQLGGICPLHLVPQICHILGDCVGLAGTLTKVYNAILLGCICCTPFLVSKLAYQTTQGSLQDGIRGSPLRDMLSTAQNFSNSEASFLGVNAWASKEKSEGWPL